MSNEKPKTMNRAALLAVVLSGLMIFSNVMGTMIYLTIMPESAREITPRTLLGNLWLHFPAFSLTIAFLGAFILLGGILLFRQKNWARYLLSFMSVLFILVNFSLSKIVFDAMQTKENMGSSGYLAFIAAILLSVPFAIIIYSVNRKGASKS